jgi:hypothetical protein
MSKSAQNHIPNDTFLVLLIDGVKRHVGVDSDDGDAGQLRTRPQPGRDRPAVLPQQCVKSSNVVLAVRSGVGLEFLNGLIDHTSISRTLVVGKITHTQHKPPYTPNLCCTAHRADLHVFEAVHAAPLAPPG